MLSLRTVVTRKYTVRSASITSRPRFQPICQLDQLTNLSLKASYLLPFRLNLAILLLNNRLENLSRRYFLHHTPP